MSLREKRKFKKRLPYMIGGAVAAVILIVTASLFLLNKNTIELSVANQDVVRIQYGVEDDPIATALLKGTIFNTKGTPIDVHIEGDVNRYQLGSYEVSCHAKHDGMEVSANITVIVEDTLAPTIELVADPENYTNPSATYVEEGFTAIDNYDGDITDQVVRTEKDGVIVYTVTDSFGNKAEVTRTINYKDVIAPVITLSGESNIVLSPGTEYVEPGYTAVDECDGDLTAKVEVEQDIDVNVKGEYEVCYKVTDSSGNETTLIRTVLIADQIAPVITLEGGTTTYVKIGSSYTELGYTATDNEDGDISSKVTVTNNINTSQTGSYAVTYTVEDSSGNSVTAVRKVYVYEQQAENAGTVPGNKIVYLTFDDGPCSHTARLLDVLDKYNVKATFFVTAQFPNHVDLIGETYRRGHTIALHTYSHRYEEIYSSTEAYFADLEKIQSVVVQQTGERASIVRFPGGTANTVSKKYCLGIMSELAESLPYHGYYFCDWNVESADSSGKITREEVVQNVINGIQKKDISYVLQHDIHSFSVDAVEEIIVWGLANGYTFLPLTEDSPMLHQTIRN